MLPVSSVKVTEPPPSTRPVRGVRNCPLSNRTGAASGSIKLMPDASSKASAPSQTDLLSEE